MAEQTLAEVALLVRADTRRVRPDVERSATAAGRAGGEALGEGLARGIDGRLRDSRGKFVSEGAAAGAAFGRGFGKASEGSGTFARVLAVMAAKATIAGAAAGAAAPGILHLTAALIPATGAAIALPAALLAIQAASGTVRVAVLGVGNAIRSGFGSNAVQAQKDLAALTGEARTFATEVIRLRPQLAALQRTVASNFFRQFNNEVRPLASTYLPLLNDEVPALSSRMGQLAGNFLRAAQEGAAITAVRKVLSNTTDAAGHLTRAVNPVVTALANVLTVGAPSVSSVGRAFSDAAIRAANFVTQAAKTGQLRAWLEGGKQTLKDLGGILGDVGSIFGSVLRAAGAGSESLLTNLRGLTSQAAAFFRSAQGAGALTSVFTTLGALGAALRRSLAAVLPAIAASLQVLGPAIAALAAPAATLVVALAPLLPFVARFAAAIITAAVPALTALANWMANNTGALKVAVVAIGSFIAVARVASFAAGVQAAGGVMKWVASTKLGTAATKAFTAVQWALGAAMRFALGPIGLVIAAVGALTAAVVWAFRNNDQFRAGVLKAWAAIQAGVQRAVAWFTGTAWPAMRRVWESIGTGARAMWERVIRPALSALTTFLATQVAPRVTWLWRNVVAPAFAGIGQAVQFMWTRVVMPTFRAINTIMRTVVGPTFLWLWRNIIAPASHAIGRVVQAGAAVAQLAFAIWVRFMRTIVAPAVTWLWRTIIAPAFRAIGAVISGAWNSTIRPTLTALANFIKGPVVSGFRTGVAGITAAWAKVQAAARVPVAFVVNRVINPLIGGFNRIAGAFGTSKIDPIAGFDRGGQIPGRPSIRDNMLARGPGGLLKVATGEFITNTRSTLANLPILDIINRKRGPVSRRDLDPVLDGRQDGGRIGDGIGDFFGRLKSGLSGAASFISDPKAMLGKVARSALAMMPGTGALRDLVTGMGRKLIDSIGALLSSGGGAGGAIGGAGVAGGWRGMQNIIAGWFPGLNLISGFRQGSRTLSGRLSYHARGRAVDYPPSRPLAARIRSTFGARTKELITPFQDLNLLNGRPHRYTGAVWNQHNFAGGNAHVHWAAALGGLIGQSSGGPMSKLAQITSADFGSVTLQRGWNLVNNGTGRPEPLSTDASGSVEALLRQLIEVTAGNPAGFARAMGGTGAGLIREARRR